MTVHIGDTGEFPVVPMGRRRAVPKPRWTRVRVFSFTAGTVASTLYLLTLIGRGGHHVLQLPADVEQTIRAIWMFGVQVAVLAWVFDRVAPEIRSRFAATRQSDRELSTQLADLKSTVGGIDTFLRDLSEVISDYGATRRQEGYEAAMCDLAEDDVDDDDPERTIALPRMLRRVPSA